MGGRSVVAENRAAASPTRECSAHYVNRSAVARALPATTAPSVVGGGQCYPATIK